MNGEINEELEFRRWNIVISLSGERCLWFDDDFGVVFTIPDVQRLNLNLLDAFGSIGYVNIRSNKWKTLGYQCISCWNDE